MKNIQIKTILKGIIFGVFTSFMLFLPYKYPEFEKITTILIIFILPILNYFIFKNAYFVIISSLLSIKIGAFVLPLKDNFSHFCFTNKYLRFLIAFYAFWKVATLFYSFTTTLLSEFSSQSDKDYFLLIQKSFRKIYPKNIKYAALITQEFAVLAYGLFLWRKPKFVQNQFSYTQSNSVKAVYIALIMVAVIESICFHLLLFHYKLFIISFILLFLNIYTTLAIIAHLKAMIMRPTLLDNNTLFIKNGLFANTIIELKNIILVENTEKDIEFTKIDKKIKLALLKKLEMHNIRICVKNEATVNLFYGINKKANEIFFYVDDANSFLEQIKNAQYQANF